MEVDPFGQGLFFVFFFFKGLRGLSSLIRDQTLALSSEPQSPNHWTTGEVPDQVFLSFAFSHPSITQACCEHKNPSQQLDVVPNPKRPQCPNVGDIYFHARGHSGWQTAILHEVTLRSQDPALWWLCHPWVLRRPCVQQAGRGGERRKGKPASFKSLP